MTRLHHSSALVPVAVLSMAWLSTPFGARARSFKRKVRGDGLKPLAVQFYGDAKAVLYIRAASSLPPRGKRPEPGTEVSIPTAWTYRVRAGDTWSGLGRSYLGNRKRGRFLAMLNGKNPNRRPPERHLITIPAQVFYRPTRPTRLKAVVKLFFRGARSAERARLVGLVMQYNALKTDVVDAAKRIAIPMMNLRVRPEMTPAELPAPDPASENRLTKALKAIQHHLDAGRFEDAAAAAMAHTASAASAPRNGPRLYLLLCTALVAMNHHKMALIAASQALDIDREIKLDPAEVSPKVRAVFEKLGWKP